MSNKLFKKLAVAYAPENIKAKLLKMDELKRAQDELRHEADACLGAILDEAGIGNHHQPNAERLAAPTFPVRKPNWVTVAP